MMSYNCEGGTGNVATSDMIDEMYGELLRFRDELESDQKR